MTEAAPYVAVQDDGGKWWVENKMCGTKQRLDSIPRGNDGRDDAALTASIMNRIYEDIYVFVTKKVIGHSRSV